MSTHVLKLGSSVLRSVADLPVAVEELYHHWREGARVLAVVSAFGDTTDRLAREAREIDEELDPFAYAELLSTGERQVAALLSLALHRAGLPCVTLAPDRIGLRTEGPVHDARPVGLDVPALERALEEHSIVVVPGFFGCDREGRTTLLGRGGSDLTALFVASCLAAEECVLLKDVDGLYEWDPARGGTPPRHFAEVHWETALRLGGEIVQSKALRFALENGLHFEIGAPGVDRATSVGNHETRWSPAPIETKPLRVGLLGLGTVGRGVYERLVARPDRFVLTGVAVRDAKKHRDLVHANGFLTEDPWQVLESGCDVIVEVMGGRELAHALILCALERGIDVVTANKEVLASDGEVLEACAEASGSRLRFSAAVGGVLPAIELVRRVRERGKIRAILGVLNGTASFVLDRLRDGDTLEAAIDAARRRGLAEADVTSDLDGLDAARKLVILAREAFGVAHLDDVVRAPFDFGIAEGSLRQVARCEMLDGCVRGSVRLEYDPRIPLTRGAENALLVEMEDGTSYALRARGAGRWPTTEAVIADLFELGRGSLRARLFARTARMARHA